MFVKHGCPRRQQSQNMAKLSKSYILTPTQPQGHVMSVKCKEPIDELTVQVWLLYHHPNFKYCTLFVNGTELRTDRRTIRLLDAPADLSGRGHKNSIYIPVWILLIFAVRQHVIACHISSIPCYRHVSTLDSEERNIKVSW